MFSLFSPIAFSSANWIPATLFAVAGLYAILGLYGWHRRDIPLAKIFAWLMLAIGSWSLGYGLELAGQTLPQKMFWGKIEYPGIVLVPVLWLEFALEYTGRTALLTRRNRLLLRLIPFTIIALFWTNEIHHLIWKSVTLIPGNGLTLLNPEYGPMFWVHVIYSYALLVIGSSISIAGALRAPRLYRAQAIATIIAAVTPLLGNIGYVFKLFPIHAIDLTLFFFVPSGIALAWGIGRYRLLDIIPPAQSAILQSLQDGVILLDQKHRILFMNNAAEVVFSRKADKCLGQPAELICPTGCTEILSQLGTGEKHLESALTINDGTQQFEIHVTPMPSPGRPEKASHLIVFHDISQRKRAESALRRRDAILSAVSLAAERFFIVGAWEESAPTVLEKLGQATESSRAYIFEQHFDKDGVSRISQRFEWAAEGIQPQIDNPELQNLSWQEKGFSRWYETFIQNRYICGLVRDFPPQERDFLAEQSILSILVMPIFDNKELWGFIGFDHCLKERAWSQPELEALHAAADILGAAISRSRAERNLQKRQQALNLIQETVRAALGRADLESMMQTLVDHLAQLIEAEQCFITLWDEDNHRVLPTASFNTARNTYRKTEIIPGERTFTESVMEERRTLVVEDAFDSPYISQRIARKFATRSALVLPLIVDERGLGAVILGYYQIHEFTPDEIEMSEQAAGLLALALAKFQAVEQAERRADESETLRRAGAAISETLNLQETTTRLLEQLAYILPHDSASVQLLRDGELEIIAGEGWEHPASVIGLRFPVPGDNPNTQVIRTGKPYLLNEADQAFPSFRQPPHDQIHSWLGVPLLIHNRAIGLLAIDSKKSRHFTPDDIELVTAFASQVAVAIENARLFNEVQQLAITDGLTGLYNRRYFMELAQNEFERSRRYKRHLSVMMFDIDHFKIVNDTYGHPFGDKVLQAIAKLCKEKLREVDPIARYGGEEFIALIVETSLVSAKKVAERLRSEVEKLVTHYAKADVRVTISIGLAEQNQNTPTLESLIARADQAMYVAKHKGRNRVVVGK